MAEQIDHPDHYNQSDIETIDAIEEWDLGFHLGNVVKYISRAGYKEGTDLITDLKKARWYLNRFIDSLERQKDQEPESQQESECLPKQFIKINGKKGYVFRENLNSYNEPHYYILEKQWDVKSSIGWLSREDLQKFKTAVKEKGIEESIQSLKETGSVCQISDSLELNLHKT